MDSGAPFRVFSPKTGRFAVEIKTGEAEKKTLSILPKNLEPETQYMDVEEVD